jgi:hypothetical protein
MNGFVQIERWDNSKCERVKITKCFQNILLTPRFSEAKAEGFTLL